MHASFCMPSREEFAESVTAPRKMPTCRTLVLTLLKLFPLGIYVRSACCKFELPYLACDAAPCPTALGRQLHPQQITGDAPGYCAPTGNTAEAKHWCEHHWVGWLNGLGRRAADALPASASLPSELPFGLPRPRPLDIGTCDEADGYLLMRAIGAFEITAWCMLWVW